MTTVDLADTATTPAALLASVRSMREVATLAEVEVLQLAVEWAHAHPVLPGDESWKVTGVGQWTFNEVDASAAGAGVEEVEWCGIPPVRWDAPAAFAAANAMSTSAGTTFIRDALILRHRLPLVWARVIAGDVPVWRARTVAQAVIGAPADVVRAVDAEVVGTAPGVGAVTLAKILDGVQLRLHAEQRELAQLEALDARHVTLHEGSINHTGIADLTARGDWKDLHDLDQTLAQVAAALKADGCDESLDVRRAMALGVLADPARAHALLTGAAAPAPTKRTTLFLHISADALAGRDTVGRNETTGRPELVQSIRDWCSRTDTHLTVTPVIDLNDHVQIDAYEIPDRLKTRMRLTHTQCVFPWCTRPARRCDCDHTVAHADGGPTSTCNLVPLCRGHHRLKTKTAWRYRPLDPVTDPGTFLWTDPHGFHYRRGPTGTTDVVVVTDRGQPLRG